MARRHFHCMEESEESFGVPLEDETNFTELASHWEA